MKWSGQNCGLGITKKHGRTEWRLQGLHQNGGIMHMQLNRAALGHSLWSMPRQSLDALMVVPVDRDSRSHTCNITKTSHILYRVGPHREVTALSYSVGNIWLC